jgi:hypothetical protein
MKAIPDWPRIMRRSTAAAYLDLSIAGFEREVAVSRLPLPFKLDGKEMWSRTSIDEAVGRLSGDSVPDWRETSKLYGGKPRAQD